MKLLGNAFSNQPVVKKPVYLFVKAISPDGHLFLNNEDDTAGGTVAYPDALQMPRRRKGRKTPCFVGDQLASIEDLEVGDEVVCYQQPTYGDRSRADSWAPAWLWDLASRNFVVVRHTPGGRTIKCDDFAGVWSLSMRYASPRWDRNGTICGANGSTYQILEILRDPSGKEYYGLVRDGDPRLELCDLHESCRDLSILPC